MLSLTRRIGLEVRVLQGKIDLASVCDHDHVRSFANADRNLRSLQDHRKTPRQRFPAPERLPAPEALEQRKSEPGPYVAQDLHSERLSDEATASMQRCKRMGHGPGLIFLSDASDKSWEPYAGMMETTVPKGSLAVVRSLRSADLARLQFRG